MSSDKAGQSAAVALVNEGAGLTAGGVNDAAATVEPETVGATPAVKKMMAKAGLKHVNGMLNIGFIAGWATAISDNEMLLQQTANPETGLRVRVNTRLKRIPKGTFRPVMIKVHIKAGGDEFGPQAAAKCIDIDRPSARDLPESQVWLAGFGKGPQSLILVREMASESFSPFDKEGRVREAYKEYVNVGQDGKFSLTERASAYADAFRMYAESMDASGSVIDSRLGAGQNYVALAGVVDSRTYVHPTEYRQGYGLIMLRQSADENELIPIRIRGRQAEAAVKAAQPGKIVMIEGALRRKVYPRDDDPTQVAEAHSYIETTSVKAAQFERDVLVRPAWFKDIVTREMARRAERKARAAAFSSGQGQDKPEMADSF